MTLRFPRSLSPLASLPLLLSLLGGCAAEEELRFTAPERAPGARAPLTAPCDDTDPTRCLLPWPSNTFTVVDESSPTKLRISVEASSLFMADDDPASLNMADGFSRVTPIVTAFAAAVGALPESTSGEGPLQVILAQHDHPRAGTRVPLRLSAMSGAAQAGGTETLIQGYPLVPLEPNADYVAVVTDELPVEDTSQRRAPRRTAVALALVSPESQAEADLAAYHAPTRAALARAGVDPARVLRVWDFTTRSEADATERLRAMRRATVSAVKKGAVAVAIDEVKVLDGGPIAAIVEGRLMGLPLFSSTDAGSGLTLDEDRQPISIGTHDAPFRVTIPVGTDDYRFVMYGHGAGGSFHDDAFDEELGEVGVAKVGIQFHGWTNGDVVSTFLGFNKVMAGSYHSTARLMQAIADGAAVEEAMLSSLREQLAAPTLGDVPNPAAGRYADGSIPMWVGGSLGGTVGAVYVGSAPEPRYGVFNVGGAAWTHFIPASSPFAMINGLLRGPYEGDLNVLIAMAIAQGNWDEIDGSTWTSQLRGKDSMFLIQESIGDPVLPNAGTDMLAVVTGAELLGEALTPIPGLAQVGPEKGPSRITQYRVPDTDELAIHGFAARDTPAGAAAREQILSFLTSAWAAAPKIELPASCAHERCDFSGSSP